MKTKRRTFREPDASPEYIAWLEERKRTICPQIQEENRGRKLNLRDARRLALLTMANAEKARTVIVEAEFEFVSRLEQ